MNKIKFTSTKLLKINGKTFVPHQLHQLPKNFEEICPSDVIRLKGFTYINNEIVNLTRFQLDTMTSNWEIDYKGRK